MQRSTGRVRLDGRLAEQVVRPPVISISAPAAGPAVAITANVHGDECTGVVAVHWLDTWLQRYLRRGAVHLYPSLNPAGLVARARGVGIDGPDMNRLFPGDPTGEPAERLAHAVWRDLQERGLSVLVDLHADSTRAIPYAIVDRPVSLRGADRRRMDEALIAFAEATGLTVLRDYPVDQYQRYGLHRSLAGAMVNRARVPAVTIEAGPRRLADPASVEAACDAVIGVLAHLDMVDAPTPVHPSRVDASPWRRSTELRTRYEGLFVPLLPPGGRFERGQALGEVRGLLGEVLEQVRAEEQGVVVSWVDALWVHVGAAVGTVGVVEGGGG